MIRRLLLLSVLLTIRPVWSQSPAAIAIATNANTRYAIESVDVLPKKRWSISRPLKEDLGKLVGRNVNPHLLDEIADRLKQETNARQVNRKISRGTQPEMVKVTFEIVSRRMNADVIIPKIVYYSRQGWSGGADFALDVTDHHMEVGFRNDGDDLMERYAGWRFRYEKRELLPRLTARFDFEDFRAQWNSSTLTAAETAGLNDPAGYSSLYRTRRVFQPGILYNLGAGFQYYAGVRLQNLEMQFPAARTEAAHAVQSTLRYQRQWKAPERTHTVEAGYDLRAATHILNSDFVYNRHYAYAAYEMEAGRQGFLARIATGTLNGLAPLVDRFILGNSTSLRGWNKFDITPLGKSRTAHASFEYRFSVLHVFYDVGAAWNRAEARPVRHSVGFGLHARNGPFCSIAFPLREGSVTPIFILGMNF